MMVPLTGASSPPEDLIMSRALVAVISMVSRARLIVSRSAASPFARSCSMTRAWTWTILKEWSSFMSRTPSDARLSLTTRVPPWSALPAAGGRPAAALKAFWASFSLAPAFLAAFWMLNTTKAARASQKPAMIATIQPTTSFWLAAKITATTNAMMKTSSPGPLMRNMENRPRAVVSLDVDEELPRDCMSPLSHTGPAARCASTPGERRPGARPRSDQRLGQDKAERVAAGVRVDPEGFRPGVEAGGAEPEHLGFGGV